MSLEIEATDVIKVILQFCKENALLESMKAIQNECQVTLNTVDNLETFLADIHAGRWDQVLPQVANLKLPKKKLEDVYEHIILELIELRETDTARSMLRQTQVCASMQQDDPERYLQLERLCNRTFVDVREIYKGTTREKRRAALAHTLTSEVAAVPPSRLMVLIGQAMKWQQHVGLLPPGAAFDLFRGTIACEHSEEETCPTVLDKTIRFGSKSHAECAVFSPDGQYLVTGSVDGFIEVWDHRTGRLSKELSYQGEEKFMMHDSAVLCLSFSRDGELLASGSQDGKIKVWRFRTGLCLRRFDSAHTQGITSVAFSRDGSQVLSSSYDGLVRLHGIKSGRMLKEYRGHTSYVNSVAYTADGATVVSASSDATVRVWDAQSCDCRAVLKPPQPTSSSEVAVHCAIPSPQNPEHIIVCNHSSTVFVMTLPGEVVKSYAAKKEGGADFLACTPSPRGEFIYCLGENGSLFCFNTSTGRMEHSLEVAEKGPIGLAHHPFQNVVATFAQEGGLKTWKPA